MTPEQCAELLDQHPDFKVLRRLNPKTEFAPQAQGLAVSRGIVLDTETTGLSSETDRVIELGMLLFEFDPTTGLIYRVLEVFDELEDPGFPIPPANTAIHHITDAMVQGKHIDDAKVERLLKGVSVVIRVLIQFSGVSQNSRAAQGARSRSQAATPHHSTRPCAKGSNTTGSRMDQVVSPTRCSIAAMNQPTMGGWS